MDFQSLKLSYSTDFGEKTLLSWDFSSNIKASNLETIFPDYDDSFSYSSECILHFLSVLKKIKHILHTTMCQGGLPSSFEVLKTKLFKNTYVDGTFF